MDHLAQVEVGVGGHLHQQLRPGLRQVVRLVQGLHGLHTNFNELVLVQSWTSLAHLPPARIRANFMQV